MKIIKIILGLLAGFYALALIPKLLRMLPYLHSPLGPSHVAGSVMGILFGSVLCIALFQSACKK